MLLFEEDLQLRQQVLACFLQAQALLGMGDAERALALLRKVLNLDQNHIGAADLMGSLPESVR
jgi:hypothetical protein